MINPPINVAILDFRNVIAKGSAEVLERHERYALALKQHSKNLDSNLIILSPAKQVSGKILSSKILRFKRIKTQKWNLVTYSFKSASYLRKTNATFCVLVAGDPWESSVAAILTKMFLRGKTPIQIQIHADIGDQNWVKISKVNSARRVLATITLRAASAIRTTTQTQAQNLIKEYGVSPEKLSLVPVQLNLPSRPTFNSDRCNLESIGIVGRIHKDRGLEKALQILDAISISYPEVSVLVAGEGPDLEWFKQELGKIIDQNKVNFFGSLEGEELELFWGKCGILISAAPAESYGRAMREAVVRGVPVLATTSAGSLELKAQSGELGVVLIDDNDNSSGITQKYELAKSTLVDAGLISKILGENAQIPSTLANSWISLRQ
jgi:glycosyltransferase involved in cell wall biosynthesis